MFNYNIKYKKCSECGGGNGAIQRTICYLNDRIEVRCKVCGHLTTFMKKESVREQIEREIAHIVKASKASHKPHRTGSKMVRSIKHGRTRSKRKAV